MRLCVSVPLFFAAESFPAAVRKVAALGYDAVEAHRWKELDLAACRRACEESGVEFFDMLTSEFCMTDPAARQVWLDGLRESCAAAKAAGARRLITLVGQDTGAPREAQRESIVRALEAAKPILEESGVMLMIEPLNSIFDHKGYYLTSAAEGFQIIREAGHPLIKMVYDIYHMQVMEGNIIPSITGNLDCIAHLHAAGHPGRHEPQSGENDYRVILAAAEKAGYTGACGLEYSPLTPPEESLAEAMRIYGAC